MVPPKIICPKKSARVSFIIMPAKISNTIWQSPEQYHVTGAVRRSKLCDLINSGRYYSIFFTRTFGCNISETRHPIHAVLVPLERPHHALSNKPKITRIQSLETKIFRPKALPKLKHNVSRN
jgi:hypothetical protein